MGRETEKVLESVPDVVRGYILDLIYGNEMEPNGFADALAAAEEELAEFDRVLREQTGKGQKIPESYHRKRGKISRRRDDLKSEVNRLQRLIWDERMNKVFARLADELTIDDQWRVFFRSAWVARMDYLDYRERLSQADDLRKEIAETAGKLALLLRRILKTGVDCPGEFTHVQELLLTTDNDELAGHNSQWWRRMRKHVLGDPEWERAKELDQENDGSIDNAALNAEFVSPDEKPYIDPVEEARNMLRYAWESAPSLPALIDTLARAATQFQPCETGHIGVAISSRKKHEAYEYLRAVLYLLHTSEQDFAMTPGLTWAVATVADVMINDPDQSVEYDDVQKAHKHVIRSVNEAKAADSL